MSRTICTLYTVTYIVLIVDFRELRSKPASPGQGMHVKYFPPQLAFLPKSGTKIRDFIWLSFSGVEEEYFNSKIFFPILFQILINTPNLNIPILEYSFFYITNIIFKLL